MASPDNVVTDESSIKPVSSLRSRFESLSSDSPSARPSLDFTGLRSPNLGSSSAKIASPDLAINPSTFRGLGINSPQLGSSRFLVSQAHPSSDDRAKTRTELNGPPTVLIESPTSPAASSDSRRAWQTYNWDESQEPISGSAVNSNPSNQATDLDRFNGLAFSPNTTSFPKSNTSSPSASRRSSETGTRLPPPINRAGKPVSPAKVSSRSISPFSDSIPLQTKEDEISPFHNTSPAAEDRDVSRRGRHEGNVSGWGTPPREQTRLRSSVTEAASSESFSNHGRAPSLPINTARAYDPSLDGMYDRRAQSNHLASMPSSGRASPTKPIKIPLQTPGDSSTEMSRSPSQRDVTPTSSQSTPFLSPKPFFIKPTPPALPAPRRSMESRRSLDTRPSLEVRRAFLNETGQDVDEDTYDEFTNTDTGPGASDYPDATQTNRRPPRIRNQNSEISLGYDTRLIAVQGQYICTGGHTTRAWNLKTEDSMSLSHGENVKVTALAWTVSTPASMNGSIVWLGTNQGGLHELDIDRKQILRTNDAAHSRREIIRIFAADENMWSLDDSGTLLRWSTRANGQNPSFDDGPTEYRVSRECSTSLVVGNFLWLAAKKEIRVYDLNSQPGQSFHTLSRPLTEESAGDVTCATRLSSQADMVYFGHSDGKITIYDRTDFTLIGVYVLSVYKISALTGVGRFLWAGYSTGMIYVYDTAATPWSVKKDWKAHNGPITAIIADKSSSWTLDRLQVVSLGLDSTIKIWDGLLEDDWIEERIHDRDEEYCEYENMSAAVMTWNAGASKPTALRANQRDANFFREYLTIYGGPDLLVFGFQEMVDLEDKKLTAKNFFKSRKKDPTDYEKMSHQYREWRDHLLKVLQDFATHGQSYVLLQTASLVGLFSCVFIKSSLRSRVTQLNGAEVKRGMGGLHGNKGALILRLIIDDTSLCFVNCHLAAGQTQTVHRNNDAAAILESENLPSLRSSTVPGTFSGGGDGTMIMDHEICILNGDLNYRIDAMTRDNVIRAVKENNLTKLLDRDQLLLSKKRNPAFRLKLFQESPISFAPTYKYNVGTDDYDTSEKKRSPAWCDRILFRNGGNGEKIKCIDYRRWEVHTSDHRPVTGLFEMKIKKIDRDRREVVKGKVEEEWLVWRRKVMGMVKQDYLVDGLGMDVKEAAKHVK